MNIQGTEEWHAERLGKLTGSRIADMLARTKTGWGATRKNYMAQLMCERLTGQREESFKSAAMERGNEVEAEARRIYGFYNNVEVEETGFVTHPTIEMAGACPDGLVGDLGGVEFKCPNTATHLETLEGASIKRVYRLQMQFCMACTGRQWWDFVSYDPRLPPELAYYCKRVHRDQEEIDEIEREAKAFLDEIENRLHHLTNVAEAAE